jgi:hypothetical protein
MIHFSGYYLIFTCGFARLHERARTNIFEAMSSPFPSILLLQTFLYPAFSDDLAHQIVFSLPYISLRGRIHALRLSILQRLATSRSSLWHFTDTLDPSVMYCTSHLTVHYAYVEARVKFLKFSLPRMLIISPLVSPFDIGHVPSGHVYLMLRHSQIRFFS